MRSLKPSPLAVLLLALATLVSVRAQSPSESPAETTPFTLAPATTPAAPFSEPLASPTASPSASPTPAASPADAVLPPVPSQNEAPQLPEASDSPSAGPDSLFVQPPPDAVPPGSSELPDLLPGTTAGENQPIFRKTPSSSSLADLQTKIRFREAKTRAANEPLLQQQLAYAEGQITLPEYREEMLTYYQRLHDRIVTLNPSVTKVADESLQLHKQWLSQRRLHSSSAAEVRAARSTAPQR